jgi:hypothetical protein
MTWTRDLRADYLVFAQRCSKCHSLGRPLNSGIDTDEYWQIYVTRMRRQPASGISLADTVPILRFLHAYSIAQRRKKAESLGAPLAPIPQAPIPQAPIPQAPIPQAPIPQAPAAGQRPTAETR